jgi:hypothetical protein
VLNRHNRFTFNGNILETGTEPWPAARDQQRLLDRPADAAGLDRRHRRVS